MRLLDKFKLTLGAVLLTSLGLQAQTISISGTVFSDGNGLTDNLISGTGTNCGGLLMVRVMSSSFDSLAGAIVNDDGTFTIINVPVGDNVLYLGTVNDPAFFDGDLPTWLHVGEKIGTGAGGDGDTDGVLYLSGYSSDITNANFGIEQMPQADNVTAVLSSEPVGGTIAEGAVTAAVSGSDPEDGILGNGNKIYISLVPENADMYYDGNNVGSGAIMYTLDNFDPAKLSFQNISSGSTNISFTYSFVDAANQISLSKGYSHSQMAIYTIEWPDVLAIGLLDFSLEEECGTTSFKWTIANPVEASAFRLLESMDGKNFNTIAVVEANESSEYSLELVSKQHSPTYYKLILEGKDGSTSESKVLTSSEGCDAQAINVYPNPAKSVIFIEDLLGSETISVYDMVGREILEVKAVKGINILPIENQKRGGYNLLVTEGREIVYHTKIVLQ